MKKTVSLVMVPCATEKLDVGMFVKVKTDNEAGYRYSYIHHFFDAPLGQCFSSSIGETTGEVADFVGNIIEAVKPYFVSEDERKNGDKCICLDEIRSNADPTSLGIKVNVFVNWLETNNCGGCRKIIVIPEQIGLVYSKENETKTSLCTYYSEVKINHLKDILEQGGKCELELEKNGELKFINKKIIIHLI